MTRAADQPDQDKRSERRQTRAEEVVYSSSIMLELREAVKTPSTTYVYARVHTALRRLLLEADLVPGDKLPTHAELAAFLHIGSPTVARAMRMLADEGLVAGIPSHGTIVL